LQNTDEIVLKHLASFPEWFPLSVAARLDGFGADGCWVWSGWKLPTGYGRVEIPNPRGSRVRPLTHRVTWLAVRGPLQPGIVLDHDGPLGCRNRSCANPKHLAPVLPWVNSVETSSGATHEAWTRTHCPKGHLLSGGNLIPSQSRRGFRSCLACNRENSAETRNLITDAARHLAMTRASYVREYTRSKTVAREVLNGCRRNGNLLSSYLR